MSSILAHAQQIDQSSRDGHGHTRPYAHTHTHKRALTHTHTCLYNPSYKVNPGRDKIFVFPPSPDLFSYPCNKIFIYYAIYFYLNCQAQFLQASQASVSLKLRLAILSLWVHPPTWTSIFEQFGARYGVRKYQARFLLRLKPNKHKQDPQLTLSFEKSKGGYLS